MTPELVPLPPSVFEHHGRFYFRTRVKGTRLKVDLGRDRAKAIDEHGRFVRQHKSHEYVLKALYRSDAQRIGGIPAGILRDLLKGVIKRARTRSLECTLSGANMIALAQRAGGSCEVSGIKFEIGGDGNGKRLWMPSVDRKDCNRGYTPDNVRLVCAAVNIALQDFGDDVMLRIAKGIVTVGNKRRKSLTNKGRKSPEVGNQIPQSQTQHIETSTT